MNTKTIFLVLCCLFANSVFAQKNPSVLDNLPKFQVSDASLSDCMKERYKVDATRLSSALLQHEKLIIQPPTELVQAVYNALVAVQLSKHAAVDTIHQHRVQTLPKTDAQSVVLLYDHTINWVGLTYRRVDSTGDAGLNRFIRKFNLIWTNMVYLDEEYAAFVFHSPKPFDTEVALYQLFASDSIKSIPVVNLFGDGNNINIQRTSTGWQLIYSVRFGNCKEQCQKYRNWIFAVANDGTVTYVGCEGDVIPPWVASSAETNKHSCK